MTPIENIEDLRAVQLGIMDAIHDFCEANGIKYSISSGSLIGAVRHGGYVPWDDDIDIYMLRRDYEKFCNTFNREGSPFRVLTYQANPGYFYAFAKVEDRRTVLVEDRHEPFELGVNVDIFPIDAVADGKYAKRLAFTKARVIRRIIDFKVLKSAKERGPLKNGMLAVLRTMLLPVKYKFLYRRLESCFDKDNEDSAEVYNYTKGVSRISSCFSRKCFETTIDIPFEDRTYKAMAGYHDYLSHTYGDYMKLPPVEKQRTCHFFKAYYKD